MIRKVRLIIHGIMVNLWNSEYNWYCMVIVNTIVGCKFEGEEK
jgi:hypothetical protein